MPARPGATLLVQYAGDERETSPKDVDRDLDKLLNLEYDRIPVSWFMGTEFAPPGRSAAARHRDDWEISHQSKSEHRGERECLHATRESDWDIVAFVVAPLTKQRGPDRLAWAICAATVVARHRTTGELHLRSMLHNAAHVEELLAQIAKQAPTGVRRRLQQLAGRRAVDDVRRARVNLSVMWGYRRHVQRMTRQYPGVRGRRYAGADWNLDHRLEWVRRLLRQVWKGTGMRPLFPGRSLGPRAIDGGVTDMRGRILRVIDTTSNHMALLLELAPRTP